jgi:hypothetical protein
MSLQSMFHLQSMLQHSQESISVGQLSAFLIGNEPSIREPSQAYERMGHTKPFVATAMRKLKRLRNEFNLSNPATLQFHIEAIVASAYVPVDLLFGQSHARQSIFNRNLGPVDVVFRQISEPRE